MSDIKFKSPRAAKLAVAEHKGSKYLTEEEAIRLHVLRETLKYLRSLDLV